MAAPPKLRGNLTSGKCFIRHPFRPNPKLLECPAVHLQQRSRFFGCNPAVSGNRVNGLTVQNAERDRFQLGTLVGKLLLAEFDAVFPTMLVDELLHRASGY